MIYGPAMSFLVTKCTLAMHCCLKIGPHFALQLAPEFVDCSLYSSSTIVCCSNIQFLTFAIFSPIQQVPPQTLLPSSPEDGLLLG